MATQLMTSNAPAEKFTFRTREAAAAAGVSLSKLYMELRAGRLQARKMGGITIILREDLHAWLRDLPAKVKVSLPHRERMKRQWAARRESEAQ